MKILRKILLFLCAMTITVTSAAPAFAAETTTDPVLTTRDDFVWGLNMHHNYYSVYGTDKLEEQIHLAAEMGCKILRNNFNVNDLYHMDTFVKLCNAYGIQIMMVVNGNLRGWGTDGELQEDHDLFYMVANRYNGKNDHGKIDYIQLDNELDVYFSTLVSGFGNGSQISQYPMDDLERITRNLKNASAAIREADSDVRIVINGGWEHVGMFTYFQQQGVDYDVLGWDWYTDMSRNYISRGSTPFGVYDTLVTMFHKPIMICETNIWTYELPDENDPATWDGLVEICEDAYSKPNVIGCIFYQMCDQLNFEKDGKFNREAHFGFISSDQYGNMTGKKAAYDRFQYICGGSATPLVTIESLNEQNEDDPEDEPADPSKKKPKKNDKKQNNKKRNKKTDTTPEKKTKPQKEPKKESKKEPVSPISNGDTPTNDSGIGQDIADIDIEETPEEPVEDIPTEIEETPTEGEDTPVRTYHKGNATKKFVWTKENTWTVVIYAVTLVIVSVGAVLFFKMKKKIKAITKP